MVLLEGRYGLAANGPVPRWHILLNAVALMTVTALRKKGPPSAGVVCFFFPPSNRRSKKIETSFSTPCFLSDGHLVCTY